MSTRKNLPWRGWSKEKPSRHQRTVMLKKCGQKCFLGPNKSFPICKKNTCKVSQKGVYAAYVRAREWGSTKKTSFKGRSRPKYTRKTYNKIASKAYKMLK